VREAKGWQVSNADVRYGDAHLTLDGTLRDTIEARWSLTAPSLQRLLPQANGSLNTSGTANGLVKAPHVVAKIDGTNLQYQDWTVGRVLLDGDIDASGAQPSRLNASATRVGKGGPLLESIRVAGEGTAAAHRINLDVTGIPEGAGDAPPTASLSVTGKLEQQVWNATIQTTQIAVGEPLQNITIADATHVMVSSDRAELDNLCLVIAAGRLCSSGKWERNGPWEGTIAGYEIPLAILLPPSGEEADYAGRIEGRVHASGLPGKPWIAEAGMRIIDAAIVYTPQGAEPETLQLGTGGLAATATPERVEFSFGLQAFTDTFLYANARLQRDGSNDLLHIPLVGDMRARAGDANILPLAFADIDHAAGVLTGNANFTGTLAQPEVSGRLELTDGEFDSYRVNLALRKLNLRADIASNGLDFTGTGRAGEGQLELDGRFRWVDRKSNGTLNVRGTNLLVADLPEYRVVASPDLHFKIDGNQIDATGDVNIPSALVQPAKLTGAVRTSADARYTDEHDDERDSRFITRGDIHIKMGDDVRVDAFGLQGRILGAVNTITKTGEDPIGRGELNVAEGRYEAYGQKLGINRGRLLFESSPLDDPGLDIEARREIETVTVGLNVRGTLQEPRITFFSDPSMPQTQIVSYLLVGKPVDSIQSGDTTQVNSARNALAMQGGGLIASQLGRRLGLEEVGVESSIGNSGETNTALVLGKFLSPRLFISYGISLTESINTLKLRYTLSDRWVLKTEAGEDQSADVEYSIEK
jgi:translocation and assembly module TamB